MLSWSSRTRCPARLPCSASRSIRLRRDEMIAISLPEKNPLPSNRITIATTMMRGSGMRREWHSSSPGALSGPGPLW